MKKKLFGNANPLIFERAKFLRNHPTFFEDLLWQYLKTKPFGYKFRRQHPFLCYILDFYCHQLKLVIELDGSIHSLVEVKENDIIRERDLEKNGLKILRFSNREVKEHPEKVIAQINNFLKYEYTKLNIKYT